MNNAYINNIISKHKVLIDNAKSERELKLRTMKANLELKRVGYEGRFKLKDYGLVENNRIATINTQGKEIKVIMDENVDLNKIIYTKDEHLPFKALNIPDANTLGVKLITTNYSDGNSGDKVYNTKCFTQK